MRFEWKRLSAWQRFGLMAGPVVATLVATVPSPLHTIEGAGHRPAYAAAAGLLMAIWWFTEALPIEWTACVPLVLFPTLGIFGDGYATNLRESALPYTEAYIFLFLGGMAIGAAMENWGLHRRIALHIMRLIGTEPKLLLLGMLVATASISLWISNTATAVMMLPIAMALLHQLEDSRGGRPLPHFGTAVMLSVAYGANVGGIGTKIGTGTNSIFVGYVSEKLGRDIGFLEYMAMGLPFVALFVPVIWGVLWMSARRDGVTEDRGHEVIDRELAAMGSLSRGERVTAMIFTTAAVLWIAGDFIRPLLIPHLPLPWPGFKFQGKHYEAAVSMLALVALLLTRVLSLRDLRRIPWGTLVLLGGSFALAAGIEKSGLSIWLAQQLALLYHLDPLPQLLLVSIATVLLTAFASNTATVNVMLNVLPKSLPLLAATCIASSCDFALPAGTPPNAIVFGSGRVRLPEMMKTGILLDLLAAVIVAFYSLWWVRWVLE
jgi:sodium-dependent dicarboxylate transporter 2/3/5